MQPSKTFSSANREEDSSKRGQILDGARKMFMELGFDGAGMGEIAKVAGASNGSPYAYFVDKCALFEAIVVEENIEQRKVAFNLEPSRDVPITLHEIGEAHIAIICRPGGGSAIRSVMAIAKRMPEVGKRFYDPVLEKSSNRLAVQLEAHVAQGELVIDDCQFAASQFMLMCEVRFSSHSYSRSHQPPRSTASGKS